jgi:hypothetical protein
MKKNEDYENFYKTDWNNDPLKYKIRKQIKCLHKNCKECKGTGVKSNGHSCIHMISCSCFNCSPRM